MSIGIKKDKGKASTTSSPKKKKKRAPNTAKYPYIAVFNSDTCKTEREAIETKCDKENKEKDAPKTPPKSAKNTPKKVSKLGEVSKKLEGAIKSLDERVKDVLGYGETQKKDPDTAWMNTHCEGLWVKPIKDNTGQFLDEAEKLKKALSNDIMQTAMDAGGKITQVAKDKAVDYGKNVVIRQTGAAATLIVPVVGEVVVVGAAAWNVVDGIRTALTTSVAVYGKAKEAYDKITGMTKQLDKLNEFITGKMTPQEAMAETMAILADANPCLQARKCQLVPFNKTEGAKKQAENGTGCCPGQTGHHVIPNAAAKECGGKYTRGSAPTICLEGADNHFGSHGLAHTRLEKDLSDYNGGTDAPAKDIDRKEMQKRALEAVKPFTAGCSPECMEAQLEAYYKDCKKMYANPGTGVQNEDVASSKGPRKSG